jgi:hypothetical protein
VVLTEHRSSFDGEAPASAPLRFRRREPAKTLLYTIVREHLESFLAQARERSSHGRSLPALVERAHTQRVEC